MKLDSLMRIDRRVIFLLTAVVIAVPIIVPMKLPMGVQKPTRKLFETVDGIDPKRQCLMISTDYVPQTEAENQPMTVALLRHAFAARIPVLIIALYVEGAGMPLDAMNRTMAEFNARAKSPADSIVYGRDVIYLGWQPPPIVPIIGMGRSIANVYPVDWFGKKTDGMPLMQRMRTYDDVGIVCAISSGASPLWFVQFAQPKFGVKVGAGCTAVSTPDFYPYFDTGQFSGMMGGMKGAAEYEYMVQAKYGVDGRQRATEGMGAQSAAHLLIIALVIVCNVAYFAGRGKGK